MYLVYTFEGFVFRSLIEQNVDYLEQILSRLMLRKKMTGFLKQFKI